MKTDEFVFQYNRMMASLPGAKDLPDEDRKLRLQEFKRQFIDWPYVRFRACIDEGLKSWRWFPVPGDIRDIDTRLHGPAGQPTPATVNDKEARHEAARALLTEKWASCSFETKNDYLQRAHKEIMSRIEAQNWEWMIPKLTNFRARMLFAKDNNIDLD